MNEEMKFKPSSLERKNLSRPWGVMHRDKLPIQPHARGWKTVTLFFLDTSEAFPRYKFKGLCGVFCHSKNSKEQEATGRLEKRLPQPPAWASCALGWVLSPVPPHSSFPCSQRGLPAAGSSGSCSRNLQPSHQRKTRHLDSKQLIEGVVEKTGRRPDITVPVCWGPWFSLVQLAPGTLAQPMWRSSFHARI